MFSQDDTFDKAIYNIYNSTYTRSIKKGYVRTVSKNDFIRNLYKGSQGEDYVKNIISHYVPQNVDYNQFIMVNGDTYQDSAHADYYDKIIVYNVVEYYFTPVIVGKRYKFIY